MTKVPDRVPKRSPVRTIADIAFCAAIVPSTTATLPAQMSQFPQADETVSPK
jgi:hypothetical protein